MDVLFSILQTAFQISFTILALATLIAGCWLYSTYVGHSLGVLICQLSNYLSPGNVQREHNHAGHMRRVQSVTAGFLGVVLCWVGMTCEVVHLLTAAEKGDLNLQWNTWDMVGVSLKGYVEGLIAFGVLAGTAKVFGLNL